MEVNETNCTQVESPQNETPAKLTKQEIIDKLKEIKENGCEANKQEIEFLKLNFYKQNIADLEAAKKAFVENGGDAADFTSQLGPLEQEFKTIMSSIKEQRNAINAALEQEKETNLQRKLDILGKMKECIESTDDLNKNYHTFKDLQQAWNEIKQVPANKVTELWNEYQVTCEKFYDMVKLNNEFREYDFKKNLEQKTHLCETAEKLTEEADVISAFHQLQKLHQEFRGIGPVAKELREEIWLRFKAASTIINRRHQEYFIAIKDREQNNLDQKTVICEIVEGIDFEALKTFAEWDEKTQEILALQAKWKTIGFTPKRVNTKIFERFRAACDEFFSKKSAFFKSIKGNMAENLEKKKALCEKAEALKDSTDWKKTSEVLSKLQKEWKAVGPVAKKHSDAVWHRFISACDYFFDQKNKATHNQHSVESENLEKKLSIIKNLQELDESGAADNSTQEAVKAAIKSWNAVGFVPFKDKDRIYKEFHGLVDKLFDKLNLSASEKKLSNFKSSLKPESNLYRERERLVRNSENLKNDIQTYENNLGFLSSSSKKGNSLVNEITRKIEHLRADLELVYKKIAAIDEALANKA